MKETYDLWQDVHKTSSYTYHFFKIDVRSCTFKLVGLTSLTDVAVAYGRVVELRSTKLCHASCVALREWCRAMRISTCVDEVLSVEGVVVHGESRVASSGVVHR